MSQRPSLWSAAWWNTAPPPWRASRRPACSASSWKTQAAWKPKWPSGMRSSGERGSPCGCCGARGIGPCCTCSGPPGSSRTWTSPAPETFWPGTATAPFRRRKPWPSCKPGCGSRGLPPRDRPFPGLPLGGCGGLYPQPGQKLQMFWVLEGLLQRAGGPKAVRPDTKVQAGLHPPVDTGALLVAAHRGGIAPRILYYI